MFESLNQRYEDFCWWQIEDDHMKESLRQQLLKYINEHGVSDTHIFVELCAMPDKIPFYEKFGFSANEAQRLRMMYHVEK